MKNATESFCLQSHACDRGEAPMAYGRHGVHLVALGGPGLDVGPVPAAGRGRAGSRAVRRVVHELTLKWNMAVHELILNWLYMSSSLNKHGWTWLHLKLNSCPASYHFNINSSTDMYLKLNSGTGMYFKLNSCIAICSKTNHMCNHLFSKSTRAQQSRAVRRVGKLQRRGQLELQLTGFAFIMLSLRVCSLDVNGCC